MVQILLIPEFNVGTQDRPAEEATMAQRLIESSLMSNDGNWIPLAAKQSMLLNSRPDLRRDLMPI